MVFPLAALAGSPSVRSMTVCDQRKASAISSV
jgi:hypothetical protein